MFKLYIIHFEKKFHHAQHYIGITARTLETRLKRHRRGDGSKLTRAVIKAGIILESIHEINEYPDRETARAAEIQLKRRHDRCFLCPKCKKEFRKHATERQKKNRIQQRAAKNAGIHDRSAGNGDPGTAQESAAGIKGINYLQP